MNLPEDQWIQAIEIKPRRARARPPRHRVHAAGRRADSDGGTLGPTNIGGVSPNKPGLVFEPGVAPLLRGNSDIILQMHYTTNGKATPSIARRSGSSSPRSRRRSCSAAAWCCSRAS